MLVDPQFGQCILCTARPPDSREHIIPACIGGTLQALILCTACNSQFGADLICQLKGDPNIRLAVAHLRTRIPKLAAQFEEGLDFVAEGTGGTTVVVSQKKGRWKTRAKEITGGCLVMDTMDAEKHLRNGLKKQGMPGTKVEVWARKFEDCSNGQEFQPPTGETFLKNEATVGLPQLTGRFVDDRVPAFIAYEFLALCLGERILGPDFSAVRDYIRVGTRTEQVQVLPKRTRQCTPDHRVRFRLRDNTLTVFVQFFRCYVFEIRFCNIPMPSEEIVFIEDLENRQRLLALSPEDAGHRNWTVL
jgi:hypothetical protein